MNEPQGEVERDDAIVGQAFVWSGGLLLVLIAIGSSFFVLCVILYLDKFLSKYFAFPIKQRKTY